VLCEYIVNTKYCEGAGRTALGLPLLKRYIIMYIAFIASCLFVFICVCGLLRERFVYSGVCTAIMLIVELNFREGSRQRKTFISLFILHFFLYCYSSYLESLEQTLLKISIITCALITM